MKIYINKAEIKLKKYFFNNINNKIKYELKLIIKLITN